MKKILILLLFCFTMSGFAAMSPVKKIPPFHGSYGPIPLTVQQQMKKYTWRPSCPVPLNQLAYVKVAYWGFDHQVHQGIIITNRDLAQQVVSIFHKLYQQHFPIQHIQPLYTFKGNDEASMEMNNTASFHCRSITGRSDVYSQHAYGRAIDINPLINPYVKGKQVLPKNSKPFLNRRVKHKGMIRKGSVAYEDFINKGWRWGGNWNSLKDYQHFEKPGV